MIVRYAGDTYDCTKAIREGNEATLHLKKGETIEFSGVSDSAWDKFTLEGGAWEIRSPAPSEAERLTALESAVVALMGGGGIV